MTEQEGGYNMNIDRCILCNSEDVTTIELPYNTTPYIFECNRCGQQFTIDDLKEWQEAENDKKNCLECWYEVYIYSFKKYWMLVYHARNYGEVTRFAESLARKGVYDAYLRAEYWERRSDGIYYICDMDLKINKGVVC